MHQTRAAGRTLLGVLTAVALLLASCSDPPPPSEATSSIEQPAITDAPVGSDAADAAFASEAIICHGQAIQLTELVPDRSSNPALVALASEIGTVQRPELELMKVLRVQWNSESDAPPAAPDFKGPVDGATTDRLVSASGPEFDSLWLQSMIGLHRKTIQLTGVEIADGKNVDAVGLAKQMRNHLQPQLVQMEQMLGAA
jgi:uncharacterized protein (DUF305 family)